MQQYLALLNDVIENGVDVETEKGLTRSLLGAKVTYDITDSLPVITLRKTNYRWALAEMLMFIKGISHTDFLKEYGAEKIWEKQGLSEDFVVSSKVHPQDLIKLLVEKGISASDKEARELIHEHTTVYKAKMDEFAKELQNTEMTEEVDKEFQLKREQINAEFEKQFTDLGISLNTETVLKTKGDLGPIYGTQWRTWFAINPVNNSLMNLDQLKEVTWKLKNIPNSRQNMLVAWNPANIARENHSYDDKIRNGFMGQPPCHFASQFIARKVEGSDKRELHAIVYMRSNDLVLGHGFNVIGYAMLTHLLASECDMVAKSVTFLIGDAHIYMNHMDDLKPMLENDPNKFKQPTFKLPEGTTIENVTYDVLVEAVGEYESYPHINFELRV